MGMGMRRYMYTYRYKYRYRYVSIRIRIPLYLCHMQAELRRVYEADGHRQGPEAPLT